MDVGESVRCLTVDMLRALDPVQIGVIGRGQLRRGSTSLLRPLLAGGPVGVPDGCDDCTGPTECLS